MRSREAYVIGSGPNGMAAAITLARAGVKTTVLEAQPTLGGGARSAPLTLPGFVHDICSAVHPLAASSPFFRSVPLKEYGLEWIQPPTPLAHPLDGGRAVAAEVSVRRTAEQLGRDGAAYRRWVTPLTADWRELVSDLLAPPHLPKHPLILARFGAMSAWSASAIAHTFFRDDAARALFAGMAAHSFLPLEAFGSGAFGWVLTLSAHSVGWPIARGGSQKITDALVSYFESLGGTVIANHEVRSIRELPPEATILCDITPRQLLAIAADALPENYCRKLAAYKYGPGVFKVDWALREPIPWQSEICRRAGTVHVCGSFGEVAASERAAWAGKPCSRPFVLLSQPSLFDGTRAPAGQHTAWAYCHVPNGSRENMTGIIEAQVERFAPGFGETILARHTMSTAQMQSHNANLIGGDINGGSVAGSQLFLRPTRSLYRTPNPRLLLCSSSTPPGGGVHGMCGYYAARAALTLSCAAKNGSAST